MWTQRFSTCPHVQVICNVARANKEDVDIAVAAASVSNGAEE